MTDDKREPHPKDLVPPSEGVIVPVEDLHLVNDRSPTAGVRPVTDDARVLDRRPTDGPL